MIENIARRSMEKLKVKIFDNKGITLIELLVTLTISAILLPVTYGALITGYKVYEKVSIDAQLREDADYVSSMVMKHLYSYPFDSIEECTPDHSGCIKFVNDTEKNVSSYSGKSFYEVKNEDVLHDEQKLELVNIDGKEQWSFNGEILDTSSDFSGSTISTSCSTNPCKDAMIQMTYKVSHPKFSKTLQLESRFGF
ncbi:prepilin-type N-terminal cleavage/methylation domain-containing protein [Rossellomorea sp. SC111]|uniref:PilW family protein n=1 Tax=Rossellomorea sp. SC111 TaxID=2968985 RepID=UPI00215A5678|nr:prepilin-type N-terminal cleavage/methylation domain-containing protein [Rossellomorea sp. SC111]MCR8850139.1 prepilin-type N-terminal cleavage/methylation domain-containing protein [Rossellomorea sp. SC111]